MIKHRDDLVKVVNITKGQNWIDESGKEHVENFRVVEHQHDAVPYKIEESIVVRREVAEHLVKKAYSVYKHIHSLKIEELPAAQRSQTGFVKSEQENEKLKSQVEILNEQLEKTKAENEKLKKESTKKFARA